MYKDFIKRFFDLSLSIFLAPFILLILLPFMIIIFLEDKGPVFYISERIGKNGVTYLMYKLRTMKVNAPDLRLEDGSTFSSQSDARVTKIGKFLRESSIDELPQLINILKGEMSFIGPRPDVQLNSSNIDDILFELKVLPGITGYNQAYFRNESNRAEKIKNDMYYQSNLSFLLDLNIIFRTFKIVLFKENIYRVNK